MDMTLRISDDLKHDEASELVEIAREQDRPIGALLLEAAREIARQRRAKREQKAPQGEPQAA